MPEFTDSTGLFTCEVATDPPDAPYPSMVRLDFYDDGASLLADDARRLADMLVLAANLADSRTRASKRGEQHAREI